MTATGDMRPGAVAAIRRRAERVTEQPRALIAILALVGVAVRHAWLTTRPLAAGDWHWPAPGRLLAWSPWPAIWDATLGFGGENRFLEVFRFPIFAVTGWVASFGGTWTLAEKIIYFVPFAALLPIAGWLLAREILGPTRWTLLTPVLLLGNTYFMIEADGHVPLPLAEMVACLALVAFVRAMRSGSRRPALLTGLLLSASAICDVRAAYIAVWLMAGYVAVLAIAEPGWRLLAKRLALSAAVGAVFLATQAFWIVPLLTYHGHPGFPTPQVPNFNIITLGHGIAGVSANWTGGTPAALVQAPLNPMFLVIPLLAMIPLVARRVRPELLWLAIAALIAAFLAKTTTPPLGGLYEALFLHLPGFRLFREGSKFLFPVAVAYSILVPAALQGAFEKSRGLRLPMARLLRAAAAFGVIAVVVITVSTIVVLERGQLGSTTTPTNQPAAFSQLSKLLDSDHQPGSVLWFGSPLFGTSEGKSHHYLITSSTHPVVPLTGIVDTTMVNRRDTFQYYCPTINQAFCYLRPDLFPYLVQATGSSYIVSPGSADMGNLPRGVNRTWLRQQLSAIFGPPMELGQRGTKLLAWRAPPASPPVAGFPAIALVDSGPWSASAVLPALQAMGIPAAYRQSFDRADFPPAPAGLPDAVNVVPLVDGGCRSTEARDVAILAGTPQDTLLTNVGGSARVLPLLARSSRLAGWGLYGPVAISAGLTPISVVGSREPPGPCVEWSPLTRVAFGDHTQPIRSTRVAAKGEVITAAVTPPAPAWTELRRLYDPGWRLGGHRPQAVAEGLFNLYHGPPTSPGTMRFSFSTKSWELIGRLIAGIALLLALLLILTSPRRSGDEPSLRAGSQVEALEGRVAGWAGSLGLSLLAVTAIVVGLQWVGAPTHFPRITIGSDPYTVDQLIGSLALAALAASVFLRLGHRALGRLPLGGVLRTRRMAGAVATAACLVASSCAGVAAGGARALASAESAGQLSRAAVGESLDDARAQRAARHPHACIADYTSALRSFPGLAAAYSGRAACYLSGSINASAAVHDDSKALALAPDSPSVYLDRAGAYRASGDLDASVQDFSRGAAVPSATAGDVLIAVDAVLAMDRLGQAQTMVRMASDRFPDSAVVALAAADAAVVADDGTAADAFARAQRLAAPSKADGALVLASVCHWQLLRNDLPGALDSCSLSAAVSRDGSGAYDDLAAAHTGVGQLDAAVADLTNAIGAFQGSIGPFAQQAGVDGFGLANLLEERGRLLVERHEPNLAVADYRRAKAALPASSPDFAARLKADILSASRD